MKTMKILNYSLLFMVILLYNCVSKIFRKDRLKNENNCFIFGIISYGMWKEYR